LTVRISAARALGGLAIGGSIAVSGCCLTATAVTDGAFTTELTEETLRRTSFAERLKPGMLVNLERPMRADGRFDGHIVQGHVDGVGTIRALTPRDDGAELEVSLPPLLERYVVEKGSI